MTEQSLAAALAGLGIAADGTLTEVAPEPQKRARGEERRDYQRSPDWWRNPEYFDPDCNCGGCPSIPCPFRSEIYDPRVLVGTPIAEHEFLRRSGLAGTIYADCRLTNWEARTDQDGTRLAKVLSFVATWPPAKPQLLLHGSIGTGKTHLAAAVLRYVWEHYGIIGRYWEALELVEYIQSTWSTDDESSQHEIMRYLRTSPLLLIDDVGKLRDSTWNREFAFTLFNARYRAKDRATIVTVQERPKLDATWDRLLDTARTVAVQFSGQSWRTK